MEDPWNQAPEHAFLLTSSPEAAPDQPEYLDITFKAGVPVALNGKEYGLVDLIQECNKIAGKHGVGRIDHVENRLVGIKSRELYECSGAITLLAAHKEIKDLATYTSADTFDQAARPAIAPGSSGPGWHDLPIDRQLTSDLLGFQAPYTNSLDAVSDWDFALEYLASKGIPFRQAHEIVGKLVLDCTKKGIYLQEVPLADYQAISEVIEEDIYMALDPRVPVQRRQSLGGTGFDQVRAQIRAARSDL